ncbi:helix-turn-helix domain-containing protein [Pseudomonas lactis]|uniref:Transcriptional regulator SutA RNAP-binding domain-containing protein n=1 Tax=Pseudomonas lactis TaxID=1615674 RepID=A0A7Y1M8A7_9PSED|nr:helix-turn-helix domain-containing protein [Pseudomonas lactis]KRP69180.1 hypothetical protein TX24_29990 [Pseudomonas lactis]NNA77063.1 hypothetical protein [Pseudomonas lactis]NNA83112.1 hypothetical protein [Pseudomonas lactis]
MISILHNEVERLRPAQEELAAQVAEFVAAGGEIEEIKPPPPPKPVVYVPQEPPAPKPFVRRRVEATVLPTDPLDARKDRRAEKAEMVKAMAPTHTQTEVSAVTGMTLRTLRDLAKDFGFSFKRATHGGHYGEQWRQDTKAKHAEYAERIKAFKELGITRRRVCGKLAISNRTLESILTEYSIDYPKARKGSTSCAA